MTVKVRISSQQMICLLAIFTLVASSLFLPASMAREAGPDAWAAVLVGIAVGTLPVAMPLGLLARRHPHVGFSKLTETCLGRWPGKLACLLLSGFSMFVCSLVLRNIMDFAAVALLPGTPMVIVGALVAIAMGYATWSGSEVITRLAVLVLILVCLAFTFMGLGLLNDLRLSHLRPMLGHGVMPVLRGAWPLTGWTGEFIVMAPFVPLISRPRKALSALLWGNGLAALVLMWLVALAVGVFTPELVMKFTYPTYSLAREVAVVQFLERLEIGLITVWLCGMVVKAAICLWSAAHCAAGALGLKHDRYLVPVVVLAALGLASLWSSEISQATFSTKLWTPMMLPFEVGLPMLLLLGSWLRVRPGQGVSA